MANVSPDVPIDVFVGDVRRWSFLFTKSNRKEARPLNGYHGWVEWWMRDTDPHLVWASAVDEANGLLLYDALGTEFPAAAVGKEVFAQPFVSSKDWYIGSSALGRGYHVVAGEICTFRVMAQPT